MNLDKFSLLINEERMSGVRASWTNREVKNTIKSMLRMDRFKQLNDNRFIEAFMEKFGSFIKSKKLDKKTIKDLAKIELKKQREIIK